jgi:hypothetical protein
VINIGDARGDFDEGAYVSMLIVTYNRANSIHYADVKNRLFLELAIDSSTFPLLVYRAFYWPARRSSFSSATQGLGRVKRRAMTKVTRVDDQLCSVFYSRMTTAIR